MNDDKAHIDYFELIPKYLSGNATDPEVKLLEEWVLSSSDNKSQFNAFKKAWVLSGIDGNEQNIDVEKEWIVTEDQLFSEDKIVPLQSKPKRRINLFFRIAAVAAVFIFASIWVFQTLNKTDFIEVVSQNTIEESELPDGTEIALNQYSTVKYAKGQSEDFRRVELTGDAFFEVERDTLRPFLISTENVEIAVLGTAFYVDARADQAQVQVIVQSGSVAVKAGDEAVFLGANEIGIYDKTNGTLIKKQNEDVNYMAWKTDVLVFEDIKFENVVFDLNRKFHSNISIADEEIRACEINTTFERQPLEDIIKIIESTWGIKADINGDQIVFSGKICK